MNTHNLTRILFGLLLTAAVTSCGSVKSQEPDASLGVDATTTDAPPPADAPPADAAFTCTPDTSSCADNIVTICDSNGMTNDAPCTLGCFDTERCAALDPSNGLATYLDDAATTLDVTLTGLTTIDTSLATITDGNGLVVLSTEIDSSGPVEILVIKVKSLTANNINVIGSRALAIVSDGDIAISGTLRLSAFRNTGGPGAALGNTACEGGQGSGIASVSVASGGGGGGFGSAGGRGGDSSSLTGGLGGPISGTPSLIPLRGGCRGGNGGQNSYNTSPSFLTDPGAGGGAVQLVSNTEISLGTSGAIAANGGGGKGWTGGANTACPFPGFCFPGEGAGSGGGILLEAPIVTIPTGAVLAANGGGGSCGQRQAGQDGQVSDTAATGGDCEPVAGFGSGGRGGVNTSAGGNGESGTSGNGYDHGGGGGGGVGRIRINLPLGESFSPQGLISPPATTGPIETR